MAIEFVSIEKSRAGSGNEPKPKKATTKRTAKKKAAAPKPAAEQATTTSATPAANIPSGGESASKTEEG